MSLLNEVIKIIKKIKKRKDNNNFRADKSVKNKNGKVVSWKPFTASAKRSVKQNPDFAMEEMAKKVRELSKYEAKN